MRALARNGFTTDQVKLALHAPWGSQQVRFRYERLNAANAKLADLGTTVLSASVTQNALADIKRRATFRLKDDSTINFLSDRIKPYVQVRVPPGILNGTPATGGWAEFPLGVFLLSTPKKKYEASGVMIREVEAYDQNQVLMDDKVTSKYLIAAGTNFVTAIASILTGAGITEQNLAGSTKTIPVDREWDGGTSKLAIINDLLEAINYYSLYFDEDGVAMATPYVLPAEAPSEYTYAEGSQGVISIGTVEQELDLFSVPNRWVLVVSQPDRATLKSVYTNTSANSQTSTVSRGRTIVEYRDVDAPDQATLDGLAQRMANEAAQAYEHIRFETWIMPQHSHFDNYTISYKGTTAQYREVSWTMDLVAGGGMTHEARRNVSV